MLSSSVNELENAFSKATQRLEAGKASYFNNRIFFFRIRDYLKTYSTILGTRLTTKKGPRLLV